MDKKKLPIGIDDFQVLDQIAARKYEIDLRARALRSFSEDLVK